MERHKIDHNYKHGIYYTPKILAEYLVSYATQQKHSTFFDPSFGNGSLLSAAISNSKKNFNKNIEVFGCDIYPDYSILEKSKNLVERDFFEYPVKKKFDVIVTNPPFIKFQNKVKYDYNQEIKQQLKISSKADIWVYFLLKCMDHLKQNGTLAAILPWAFLQADYAMNFRKHLAKSFREIKVLGVKSRLFHPAEERVVLLWLQDFGLQNKSIKLAYTEEPLSQVSYRRVSKKEWHSEKIGIINSRRINNLFSTLENDYQFHRFGNLGTAKIGVVTGANKYFIKTEEDWSSFSVNTVEKKKILTSVNELKTVSIDGLDSLKTTVKLDNSILSHSEYIKLGVSENIHLRAHSQRREPWYQPIVGQVPDAFLPYRVKHTPFMVLNSWKIQSTNSIHRIYFYSLTEIEQYWVSISMLSVFSQIGFIQLSKTYGRNMLKIEPGRLKELLVFKSKNKRAETIYNKLMLLIKQNQQSEAVKLATDAVVSEADIPEFLVQNVWNEYFKIF